MRNYRRENTPILSGLNNSLAALSEGGGRQRKEAKLGGAVDLWKDWTLLLSQRQKAQGRFSPTGYQLSLPTAHQIHYLPLHNSTTTGGLPNHRRRFSIDTYPVLNFLSLFTFYLLLRILLSGARRPLKCLCLAHATRWGNSSHTAHCGRCESLRQHADK